MPPPAVPNGQVWIDWPGESRNPVRSNSALSTAERRLVSSTPRSGRSNGSRSSTIRISAIESLNSDSIFGE